MKREPVGVAVEVESLDQEGRGIAHLDGKVIFIEGALPGETVEFSSYQCKAKYELAKVTRILRTSALRLTPRCPHFGVCGGCSMQHLEPRAQVAAKQRVLEDSLARIGKVTAQTMLAPIHGPTWGYRYRARFSARYLVKKHAQLVGFRERNSSFVADMQGCEVVPARISELLMPLRELIGSLSIRERIPQVELAIGDAVDVLVLRVLEALAPEDEAKLEAFSERHRIQFFLQPKGPDTAHAFCPASAPSLQYRIPDFGLTIPFKPTDFTQVNHDINRVLVRRAVSLLDPQPDERIGDFFCGLGNFSLAVAKRGARVVGVEGNSALVRRAQENAEMNGVGMLCRFVDRDLFTISAEDWSGFGMFDGMLIDPPRDGAIELVKALGEAPPARIVYVSCNPSTLARDAAVLVHSNGYRLAAAGVVNMFPHTSHVESVTLFER